MVLFRCSAFQQTMATCPRCKGHLTDTHRCPRSPTRVAVEVTFAALAGAIVALLIYSILDPHGDAPGLDALSVVGGGLLGAGLDRLIRS
jgi:hypothetical protein